MDMTAVRTQLQAAALTSSGNWAELSSSVVLFQKQAWLLIQHLELREAAGQTLHPQHFLSSLQNTVFAAAAEPDMVSVGCRRGAASHSGACFGFLSMSFPNLFPPRSLAARRHSPLFAEHQSAAFPFACPHHLKCSSFALFVLEQ